MTLSRKISALFISLALLQCVVSTGFTAQHEYQVKLNQLTEGLIAHVHSRPDLQINFYKRNETRLGQVLDIFLESPKILLAAAHTAQGDILAKVSRKKTSLPVFNTLRENFSTTQPSILTLNSSGQPIGNGILASTVNSNSNMHLTIPVFSSIDPTEKGLSDQDIAMAIINSGNNGSLVVIGYIQLVINPTQVLKSIKPLVLRAFFTNLTIVLLLSLVIIYLARRFSRSLSQLTQLAQEVTMGKRAKPMEIKGNAEIRNIANMLNGLIDNSRHLKTETDLSNKILSLKVDERSSQLSKRDEELNTATQEISQNKSELNRLAYYDSLTSLPNRRLFTEQLALLLRLNERNKNNLALLFINLDNFKRINDSLGHEAGDQVLREVAKRLTDSLRSSDAVAYQKDSRHKIGVSRWGGDEFTVVLNQLGSIDDITPVTQRLLDKLLQPMVIEGSELVVVPNIGIAIAPADADQVQGLFTAASAAMYHARASKNNDFLFYKPEMGAAGAERIKLEADLRKAVERNELVLHYQPQIDTVFGSVVGAEALLRWKHPEYGLVPPLKFISLAEEVGLIPQLGNWVLEEACRQIKSFKDRDIKLPRVAINISALQFSSTFTKRVKGMLQQMDIPPSMLELGLAESIMTDNDDSTAEALQSLRDMGVYLSVDDFGTSHSPMNYLSSYPLDELKIDRSFVKDCDNNDGGAKLVRAIIAMADSLGLSTVAEGVETEDQYRFLRRNGAKVMQGYLFSKPVTAVELETMLTPWYFAEQVQKITMHPEQEPEPEPTQ